jgi:hypothetical protein
MTAAGVATPHMYANLCLLLAAGEGAPHPSHAEGRRPQDVRYQPEGMTSHVG